MAPQAFWRVDAQFFQGPKFLKIDSTDFFLDLMQKSIKNIFLRSKKSKISENQDFHWKFSKNRKIWKIENFRFSENFRKFLIKILKSIFDQKFLIVFHKLFLNLNKIIRRFQKWRLEMRRTQRGRASERNVEVGRFCKKNTQKRTL